jgi:hypothetical protein
VHVPGDDAIDMGIFPDDGRNSHSEKTDLISSDKKQNEKDPSLDNIFLHCTILFCPG